MTTPSPGYSPDSRYLESIIGQGEYGTGKQELVPAPRYDDVYWDAVARMEGAERPGPLASICEMPGGEHGAAGGVHFLIVAAGDARARLCGHCWQPLRKGA